MTRFEVRNVRPYTYAAKPSTADAVVVRVADYTPTFDENAANERVPLHIHLVPVPALMARKPTHWLSDLYIDRARWLPARVVYNGTDNLVAAVDYTPVGAYWLVSHFSVSVGARLLLLRATVSADATLEDYAFSETPPFDFDLATPTPVKSPR